MKIEKTSSSWGRKQNQGLQTVKSSTLASQIFQMSLPPFNKPVVMLMQSPMGTQGNRAPGVRYGRDTFPHFSWSQELHFAQWLLSSQTVDKHLTCPWHAYEEGPSDVQVTRELTEGVPMKGPRKLQLGTVLWEDLTQSLILKKKGWWVSGSTSFRTDTPTAEKPGGKISLEQSQCCLQLSAAQLCISAT